MGRRSANSNGPESHWTDVEIQTVAPSDFTSDGPIRQPAAFPDLSEECEIMDNVNLEPLTNAVSRPYTGVGRRPHDRGPIVRAHLMAYLHKTVIGSITALHWTLLNNPAFRAVCGFNGKVPSRPTLSRVFTQMSEHPDVVERIMDEIIREAKRIRPDLGEDLAVDASPVHSYSDGNRKPRSDPDAEWGMHHKANTKDGFEWVFGYKMHVAACANYDFPITMKFTAGNANDSPHMISLVEDSEKRLNAFPNSVIADRGYDSERNSEWVDEQGGAPVIHKRAPKSGLHKGEYTTDGIPVCECGEVREYGFTSPTTGVHYYGGAPDCRSEDENSLCYMSFIVNPRENVRLFGGEVRRGSDEWHLAYNKRWSVERVFSRWKVEGRLNDHRLRQMTTIRLHAMFQMLALQAVILTRMKADDVTPVT